MPVHQCTRSGRPGWKWGSSGKCYIGPGAKAKAAKQGAAVRASGWTENAKPRVDPLRTDPTRTKMLRDQFVRDLHKRLNELKRRIINLVVHEDAFGLKLPYNADLLLSDYRRLFVVNQRFAFETSAKKVEAYNEWLRDQYQELVTKTEDAYWEKYIAEGYEKGAGRAFSDVYRSKRAEAYGGDEKMAHYEGTREEFLRSSFGAQETVEKVKLLAGRTLTDLKGVGEATAAQMSRILTDGLVQGQNPWTIARELTKTVEGISENRARIIARTEIIRAHAEGQLDALERLGVEEIGVQVEWSSAGDDRVCEQCQPLEGQIFQISESHGVIPLHPQCRCAWIPYTGGEVKATTPIKSVKETDKDTKAPIPKPVPTVKPSEYVPAKTIKEAKQWAIDNGAPILTMDAETASSEVATAYTEWADKMIKQDPAKWADLLKEHNPKDVKANWLKIFRSRKGNKGGKAAFSGIDSERALAVQNAINDNHLNQAYMAAKKGAYKERVLLRKAELGNGANAEYRVVTHYYDQWPYDEITSTAGSVIPGQPTVPGGIANTLRHEYGHGVYKELPTAQQAVLRKAYASHYDDIPLHLSQYAQENADEFVAELFSLVTDRNYDRSLFEPWVNDLGQELLSWLGV